MVGVIKIFRLSYSSTLTCLIGLAKKRLGRESTLLYLLEIDCRVLQAFDNELNPNVFLLLLCVVFILLVPSLFGISLANQKSKDKLYIAYFSQIELIGFAVNHQF